MAMKLQMPWKKIATVIVLKSKEGAGKNMILDKFKRIMGEYYISISNVNNVLGDFNGIVEGKMLINADEISYGGNKQQMNRMKALITEDHQVVNKKNKEMYKIDNFADYIFTTNELYFLYVTPYSRRYFVLQMDNWLAGIHTEKHKEYLKAILEVPDEVFAKFLLERDISNFNPRAFLKTPLFQKQVELNWSSEVKYLHLCLESGALKVTLPRITWNTDPGYQNNCHKFTGGFARKHQTDRTKDEYWYGYDALYGLYSQGNMGGYATIVTINSFYETLNEMFGEEIVYSTFRKQKVVKLPNINDARRLFNEHQNFNYDFSESLKPLESDPDFKEVNGCALED